MMLPVLLLSLTATVMAQSPRAGTEITVGAEPDYPPYSYLDDNGVPTGYSVELFRAVARTMGLEADLYTDYWDDLKRDLAEGRIDALPLVGRTPERDEVFDFTVPYLSLYGGIVVRNDDNRFAGFDDLQDARIAVMAGDNAEEFLRRRDEEYEIATFPTFVAALEDLAGGGSDAVVVQRLVALRLLQQEGFHNLQLLDQPITEFRQDFCFAVEEGNKDLLAALNEGLSLVVADGTLRRLETEWFSPLELPARTIIVGGDQNYPPFEYLDEEGNPAGFNVDLIQAIAREMDLNVEIRLGPWTGITTMLEQGEIDLIQGMMYSAERDRRFDFSQAHTVHQHVAVGVQNRNGGRVPETVEGLRGHRIAVQAGDIMHDFALENGLSEDLVVTDSQEEALELLLLGEVDYALGSRLTAMHLLEENGWDRLEVGHRGLVSSEYGLAVREGNIALLSHFSEGLAVIERTGEYRRIYDRWLGVYAPAEYDPRVVIRIVLLIVVPILVILFVIVLWNRTLRNQVALRTAELTASLEEQQILLKEIHHRVKNNLNVIVSLLTLQENQVDSVDSARKAFEQSRNRIYSMALVHDSLYQSDRLSEIELDEYIKALVSQLEATNLRDGEVTFACQLVPVRLDITQAVPCGLVINELVTNALKHAFVGLPGGAITVSLETPEKGLLVVSVEDNGRGMQDSVNNTDATGSLGLHLVQLLAGQLYGTVEFTAANGDTGECTGTRAVLTFPRTYSGKSA
jgi:ABC-type amino acid transport substrate-binding protein/anti-sigma regulatory factor (Ser/Thr protein kinase)